MSIRLNVHASKQARNPSPEEIRGTQGGVGTNCSTEVGTPKASFNRGAIEKQNRSSKTNLFANHVRDGSCLNKF